MQNAHHMALEAKHAVLEEKISAESHRPQPDSAMLAALKKQKLLIKQELSISTS